jgi:hypothetical protein
MTPYEEIYELIQKMKEGKATLEGTDLEYFEEKHLVELVEMTKELNLVGNEVLSSIREK